MHRSTVLAITAAASLAGAGLSAAPATAATILSLDSASLCGKAGCFAEKTTFQTSFSGPMSISGLAIDKSMLGSLANYAVKIRFMTKDGTVVGDWGAYTLAVLGGDVVTIGGKPVDWNGAAGDQGHGIAHREPARPAQGARPRDPPNRRDEGRRGLTVDHWDCLRCRRDWRGTAGSAWRWSPDRGR